MSRDPDHPQIPVGHYPHRHAHSSVRRMPRRAAYDPAVIYTLLARAGRVARTAELEALGMGRSTIHYRCRPNGPWQRILPGVLIAHSGAPTLDQHLAAALIYARPGAVLTGACALRLRGLRSAPGISIDVLVPHGRSRTSSGRVSIKRTSRLPAAQVINGLACAPIARSVVDACRTTADLDAVRAIAAEVIQRGVCSVAALADELRACSTRGSALPRRVIREISAGVRSVAEARTRALILGAGLPRPEWNVLLRTPAGRMIASPDAYWAELGVALEIDSLEWHLSPEQYQRTQARQRGMARFGIVVVPVTPGAIGDRPDEFLGELSDTLAQAVGRRSPDILVIRRSAA